MRKNIFLFAFSLVLLLLGVTSCEEALSTEDCVLINAMEINTTELKASEGNDTLTYAFTPSNAKFLNLAYTWSINGQEIEGATKSFDVCFTAIPENASSCVVESICTSVTIDSLEEETVAESCDDIVFTPVINMNGNASEKASSGVQATGEKLVNVTWILNGKELSDEDRAEFGVINIHPEISVFGFDPNSGDQNIEIIAQTTDCAKSFSFTANVD
ncbi:hypothetical protein [Aquimarina agarivorans]|uniref:hypothetical protein n=1 Tax=Aquimarina agarivorans TaxID=980584 RepID=UPI000248EAF1|nr:hypothetical protein [Aquimarina agarivorans]